ncbi:MAG: hypothetical protein H6622_18350 [Halobacteriovoraceae bacterium]|nr:hypothetical protein [Halobacteriovoraceae bacterium]
MKKEKEIKDCQSCLMPFSKDPQGDNRENPHYCSYCFRDGKLCFEGDLKSFQKFVYGKMREQGIGYCKAKFFTWIIRFAPRWKDAK